MQIYHVNKAQVEKLEEFLQKNEAIAAESLSKSSYMIEVDGKIEGCFDLKSIDESTYWLRQLYLSRSQVQKLFVVFESILIIARKKQINCVYVHNQSPVVDILLESLQFKRESDVKLKDISTKTAGNWWAYNVS